MMQYRIYCTSILLFLLFSNVTAQDVSKTDSHIKVIVAQRALSLDNGFDDILSPKNSEDVIVSLKIKDASQITKAISNNKDIFNKENIYVMAAERQCAITYFGDISGKPNEYRLAVIVPNNVIDMKLCITGYLPISFKAEKKIREKITLSDF